MPRITRPLTIVAAVGGTVYAIRARRRAKTRGTTVTEVLDQDFRSFVTHRFDPLVMRLGLAGGRRSPWAIVEHVGRTSGAVHRTPITPRIADDAMLIPLPYGTDVQWVRNVLSAGHCRVQAHETIYELDEPAIIMAEDNQMLSPTEHQVLDETAAHYLRLHILDRAPGTFMAPPAEFTTHPMPGPVPDITFVHPAAEASPVG